MDVKHMVIDDFTRAGAFLLLYAFIFLSAKLLKDCLTPYKLNDELAEKDNVAIAITMSGYYLATAIIYMGALFGPTQGLQMDLMLVAGYSVLGLVFLNTARWLNDKIILRKFCSIEQLTKEQNLGVGAVNFGIYVATGLIAAGAISGQGGGILSSVVFFILGQLSLFIFSFIYSYFTPYNIHQELEKKNTAAGVAFSGTLIALGIVILNGLSGDFVDWRTSISLFFIASVMAFIFLPLVRIVMNRLIVLKSDISAEIRDDKNLGAGVLEATVAISFAAILIQLI